MINKKVLSSKLVIAGLLLFLVFLIDLKYKQWKNQQAIEKQKQSLLAQTDTLTKKNNELNQSLQYLNSTDFKERVAREQLNLKKEGEVVYSFGSPEPQNPSPESQDKKTSNFQKWWNYFYQAE